MRAAATAMAAAALLGGGAADAQQRAKPSEAELFCHGLKRVVKAAGYESRFQHLERSRAAPPWLGFRPGACRATAASGPLGAAWSCHQHLAPPHLSLESLAEMTAACLPEAKRLPAQDRREATFETPRVRIHIGESGGPGAKVGRIVRYRVETLPAR